MITTVQGYCRVGLKAMRKSAQKFGFGMVLGLSLMIAPVMAQTIDAVTADELEAALDAAGLGPTMTQDAASGAPVASGSAGQFEFYVRAMNCSGQPAACKELMFFANFPLGRAVTTADIRKVNSFNEGQVFGRAYFIESRSIVGVDYVVELGGGVTNDHLSENIGRWADVISAFVSKFQEDASSS